MSDISLVLEQPIAWLRLNRPERHNAISSGMWQALQSYCVELQARTDIGAVILEGAGEHFCSGADIYEFDEVFANLESSSAYLQSIEQALNALSHLKCPTIAKLEGFAMGGGFALALACDMRFASESVRIAIPPAKLGLLYGPVETQLLVETVGAAVAKDLLFSGRTVNSDEASKLGLVNRVFSADEIADAVQAQARLWTELSRGSVAGAKLAVRAALDHDVSKLRSLVVAAAMSADFHEGRKAFTSKRKPRFGGEG